MYAIDAFWVGNIPTDYLWLIREILNYDIQLEVSEFNSKLLFCSSTFYK